ncbi:MAG: SPFH domain-containing protein [Oscillospiraceae bacterium]|jgi:membrane protease subunit (stomatin/prohibitin family)|nr:SPFH domain-containing protein [Oscillospiraceae bacterium]
MGLIQIAKDSIKGTLQDQQQTTITCEDMGNELLMAKKTRPNGILRNGSRIVVNPGQVAVLIDNGIVVDSSAAPGTYEWQSDASPGFFSGDFGGVFREMWTRFKFGGGTWQDQAVYYINTTEIIDNGFGTPAPVLYRDYDYATFNAMTGRELPMTVKIKCSANFSFEIDRPWIFLERLGGTANLYYKDQLLEQLAVEIVASFQEMLNSLGNDVDRIPTGSLQGSVTRIKKLMKDNEFDTNIRERGIKLVGFNIKKVTIEKESDDEMAAYRAISNDRTFMDRQQQREADMKTAVGSNPAGVGSAFMGLGIMNNMMGGGMQQPAYPQQQIPQQQFPQPGVAVMPPQQQGGQPGVAVMIPPQQAPAAADGILCVRCNTVMNGPFCAQCGTPAPPTAPAGGFCTQCGTKVAGPFCAQCGTKQ